MLSYQTKAYNDLSLDELYAIMRLRQEVFVVEQDCPYLDADGIDNQALHVMGTDSEGLLHTYARVIPRGGSYPDYASIGRVITSAQYRGKGQGAILMTEAINAADQLSWQPIKLSAQVYAIPFYERHGFTATGAEYLEDNIPHIAMIRV